MNKEVLKADLGYFGIGEVLYFLSMNKKTGRLRVKSYKEGEIYIEDGKCTHAVVNEVEGLDALLEISLFTEGSLDFEPNIIPEKKTLSGEIGVLFEQVERRSKEIRDLKNKLPPLDAILIKSDNPPDERLKLRKTDWKILSLVDGKKKIREIISQAGVGIFEAYRSLAFLIEKELVFDPEEARRRGKKLLEFFNSFIDEYSKDSSELRKSCVSFIKTSLKNTGFNEIEEKLEYSENYGKLVSKEDIIIDREKFLEIKNNFMSFFEKKFIFDFGKILGKKKFENFKRRISE